MTSDLHEYAWVGLWACRVEGLQLHYDLEVCRLGTGTDVNDLRAQRRQWQHRLNANIQRVTLELIVNIFRFNTSLQNKQFIFIWDYRSTVKLKQLRMPLRMPVNVSSIIVRK